MRSDIKQLISEIEAEVRFTSHYIGKDKLDKKVMDAMRQVPREKFVPDDLRKYALENAPLPIGHGQTISQPYIVALMSDLLALSDQDVVLEIGTGSGYQTAVLSRLCRQVFSIERKPELSVQAQHRFSALNYKNIECHVGNGCAGWSEHAPYDAIIVTAAADKIPERLFEQLKLGGSMVIPVGLAGHHQELVLVRKDQQGKLHRKNILGVSFVPLIDKTDAEDILDHNNKYH